MACFCAFFRIYSGLLFFGGVAGSPGARVVMQSPADEVRALGGIVGRIRESCGLAGVIRFFHVRRISENLFRTTRRVSLHCCHGASSDPARLCDQFLRLFDCPFFAEYECQGSGNHISDHEGSRRSAGFRTGGKQSEKKSAVTCLWQVFSSI